MGGSTEAHQPSGLGLVTISSSLLVNQPIRDFSYHPIATLSLSLSLSLLSIHFVLARSPCPQVKIKAQREVIRRSAMRAVTSRHLYAEGKKKTRE